MKGIDNDNEMITVFLVFLPYTYHRIAVIPIVIEPWYGVHSVLYRTPFEV